MAKLSTEQRATLVAGYESPSGAANPSIWSSVSWEAFEFGRYIQARGLTLGAADYWERGRGNTYRNPSGMTWKAVYGRKGAFAWERVA